jgi:hypothetical protein
LQLWLSADAGTVTNASDMVSQWLDQSSNNINVSSLGGFGPTLVYPAEFGGKAAIQFTPYYTPAQAIDILSSSSNVSVPNAMTAFTVYETFATQASPVNVVWLLGTVNGPLRTDAIYNQDFYFGMPGSSPTSTMAVPVNTCRICTDRLNTNLSTVEIYDTTATNSTNFTESISGTGTPPGAGFSVGGEIEVVGSQGGPYDTYVDPINGDIAEILIYSGYLSDPDMQVVQSYLLQKYFFSGKSNTFTYQWKFDGTNISGATNASLSLTNVQTNAAGTYSVVVVTNSGGAIISSNAVLVVGLPPSVTVQPQRQEVLPGVNSTFSANTTGTPPFSYQWSVNGQILAAGTNSALTLDNVQITNGGDYAVTVTNLFGETTFSNVLLLVDTVPAIVAQPQGQLASSGNNVTFSVFATGATIPLPTTSSGTLQLWLKSDAGVTANGGFVSQWQDQSGNGNNATQSNTNMQPSLVYPAGIGGCPALRFNGIQDVVHGSSLVGIGNVNIPNAMTAFTVYNAISASNQACVAWLIGVPENLGNCRGVVVLSQSLDFTTEGFDYRFSTILPTNTYRICTDRLITNWSTVEVYDTTATNSTNFTWEMQNTHATGSGYYVGGLNWVNPDVPTNTIADNFDGYIAELLVYSGYLTDSDILDVQTYLTQKYLLRQENGLAYQWQFDGTNITGATNATLTLTNVQTNASGNYSVIVTNLAGPTFSSNAALSVIGQNSLNIEGFENNVSELNFAGTNGQTFTLEWSTNLINWAPMSTNTIGTSGIFQISVTNQTLLPAQYFRVLEQ